MSTSETKTFHRGDLLILHFGGDQYLPLYETRLYRVVAGTLVLPGPEPDGHPDRTVCVWTRAEADSAVEAGLVESLHFTEVCIE